MEFNSPVQYAKHLASYLADPSTIRARVKDEFGRAPSVDIIRKIREDVTKKNRVEGYALCESRYRPLFKCGHSETEDNIVIGLNGIDKCRQCEEEKARIAKEREEKRKEVLRRKMEQEKAIAEAARRLDIQKTLQTILETPPSDRPRLGSDVIRGVAEMFKMQPADIVGKDRHGIYIDARCAVALIMRERGLSYPQIGRFMDRDHSTIVNLVNKAAKRIERNPLILAAMERLR